MEIYSWGQTPPNGILDDNIDDCGPCRIKICIHFGIRGRTHIVPLSMILHFVKDTVTIVIHRMKNENRRKVSKMVKTQKEISAKSW